MQILCRSCLKMVDLPQERTGASFPCPHCGQEVSDPGFTPPPAGSPAPAPAPQPAGAARLGPTASMKVLGIMAIVAGAVSAPVNVFCPLNAMHRLAGNQGAEAALVAAPLVGAAWLALSLLLLFGGIGLVRGRLWVRRLCIVFGWVSFPVALVSVVTLKVIEAHMALHGGPAQPFSLLVAIAFPGLSILLLPLLLSGVNRRWALLAGGQPGAPPQDGGGVRRSRLALASLILCVCPPPLLSHLVAVVLGLVALRKIRRSGGKLEGRALAGTAVGVGGFVVLACGGLLLLAMALAGGHREKAREAACRSNLRSIRLACEAYCQENGAFPADLNDVNRYRNARSDEARMFSCPSRPSRWEEIAGGARVSEANSSYIYVSGLQESDGPECLVAYDRPGNHRGGVNVVLVNGAVRMVSEAEFQDLLERTRQAVRRRGGEISTGAGGKPQPAAAPR